MAAIKELGLIIDEYYEQRAIRLEAERKIKELKEAETRLKYQILEILAESGLQKASGHVATASIKTTMIPVVEDWDSIYKYIVDTDRFDLLHKRLSTIAWRELYEAGEVLPGTTGVEDIDLSLTKASR